MIQAAYTGNERIASLLIDKWADVNRVSKDGTTSLMAAVAGGNRAIVQKLIDKFVDTNKATNDGLTPLYVACSKGTVC